MSDLGLSRLTDDRRSLTGRKHLQGTTTLLWRKGKCLSRGIHLSRLMERVSVSKYGRLWSSTLLMLVSAILELSLFLRLQWILCLHNPWLLTYPSRATRRLHQPETSRPAVTRDELSVCFSESGANVSEMSQPDWMATARIPFADVFRQLVSPLCLEGGFLELRKGGCEKQTKRMVSPLNTQHDICDMERNRTDTMPQLSLFGNSRPKLNEPP